MVWKCIAAGAIALVLTGCATAPKQTFNAEANTDLLRIAVITPPEPNEIQVVIMNHPGTQFGLIGGLVAAADMTAKTNAYKSAVADKAPDWAAHASVVLQKELEEVGYSVIEQKVERKPGSDFLTDYPDSSVDAYLDVKFNVSYVASTPTSDYMPGVVLSARLVNRTTKEVLYEEQYGYGYNNPYLKLVNLSSDGKYRYSNIEALTTNAPASLIGLTEGLDQIAHRVAQNLKPAHKPEAVARQ